MAPLSAVYGLMKRPVVYSYFRSDTPSLFTGHPAAYNCSGCSPCHYQYAVRGAPLIGAVAAYGLALALRTDSSDTSLEQNAAMLAATRPTAINLRWALERMLNTLRPIPPESRISAAYAEALRICNEDAAQNEAIGRHGLKLLQDIAAKKKKASA